MMIKDIFQNFVKKRNELFFVCSHGLKNDKGHDLPLILVKMKTSTGGSYIAFKKKSLGEELLTKMNMDKQCFLISVHDLTADYSFQHENDIIVFKTKNDIKKYIANKEEFANYTNTVSFKFPIKSKY